MNNISLTINSEFNQELEIYIDDNLIGVFNNHTQLVVPLSEGFHKIKIATKNKSIKRNFRFSRWIDGNGFFGYNFLSFDSVFSYCFYSSNFKVKHDGKIEILLSKKVKENFFKAHDEYCDIEVVYKNNFLQNNICKQHNHSTFKKDLGLFILCNLPLLILFLFIICYSIKNFYVSVAAFSTGKDILIRFAFLLLIYIVKNLYYLHKLYSFYFKK